MIIAHPYINSYWIEKLPNGIIHLLINCSQKEIYYHDYNETMFLIASTIEEFDNPAPELIFEIPTFLPKEDGIHYIRSHAKNKEQISFYFIPYDREYPKNKKILVHESK